MNANPQSDHPPHTCSSAPNYTLKTKPKRQSDHPLRHVLQAPKNKFPGPKKPHFSEKSDDRNRAKKRCRLCICEIEQTKKRPISGPIRPPSNINSERKKTEPQGATKMDLGHQKRTHFTSRTPFQPRLRGCGDGTTGFQYTRDMPPHLLPDLMCVYWLSDT